jgi:hypothetical protein
VDDTDLHRAAGGIRANAMDPHLHDSPIILRLARAANRSLRLTSSASAIQTLELVTVERQNASEYAPAFACLEAAQDTGVLRPVKATLAMLAASRP